MKYPKHPQDIALTDVEAGGHIGWVRVNGTLDLQICRYKNSTRIAVFRLFEGGADLLPIQDIVIHDKDAGDDSPV